MAQMTHTTSPMSSSTSNFTFTFPTQLVRADTTPAAVAPPPLLNLEQAAHNEWTPIANDEMQMLLQEIMCSAYENRSIHVGKPNAAAEIGDDYEDLLAEPI